MAQPNQSAVARDIIVWRNHRYKSRVPHRHPPLNEIISLVSLGTHLIDDVVNAGCVPLPGSARSFEVIAFEHEHTVTIDHEQIVKVVDDWRLVRSEGGVLHGSAVVAIAEFHLVLAYLTKMLKCRGIGAV